MSSADPQLKKLKTLKLAYKASPQYQRYGSIKKLADMIELIYTAIDNIGNELDHHQSISRAKAHPQKEPDATS